MSSSRLASIRLIIRSAARTIFRGRSRLSFIRLAFWLSATIVLAVSAIDVGPVNSLLLGILIIITHAKLISTTTVINRFRFLTSRLERGGCGTLSVIKACRHPSQLSVNSPLVPDLRCTTGLCHEVVVRQRRIWRDRQTLDRTTTRKPRRKDRNHQRRSTGIFQVFLRRWHKVPGPPRVAHPDVGRRDRVGHCPSHHRFPVPECLSGRFWEWRDCRPA